MKILLINQYFPPEPGAGTGRIFYYAKFLKNLGHEVLVLCGVPNYPDGKIHKGYKNRLWIKDKVDGLTIYRTLVFPTSYSSSIRRFLNYLVFTISSLIVGLFLPKVDIIIASSPPPSSGVTGLMLSILKRAPLVFEVRDVWPGAARALGYLENKFLWNLNLYMEQQIYQAAKYIVTVTNETKKLIIKHSKNLKPDKIRIITNGVDLEVFDSINSAGRGTNLKNKFVVVYTGTLGLQQGVETLIEAVKILRNENHIKFLIIGEGADRHLLEEEKLAGNLNNMILKNILPYQEAVGHIKSSDLGLTILKKNEYLDAAYPVKAFDYMAARKPILVSGGLAMKELIEKNKIGSWVPPERAKALADTILKLAKKSRTELEDMGRRGRKLTEQKFNREKQAKELEKILGDIAANK